MAKINNAGTVCNTDYLFRASISGDFPTILRIPEGVQTIKSYYFSNVTFQKIIFPKSLQNIFTYAFSGVNTDIIDLEDTDLSSLGAYGFLGAKIKKIIFPNSNYNLNVGQLFNGCNLLKYVVILQNISNNLTQQTLWSGVQLTLFDLRNTSEVRTTSLPTQINTFYVNVPDSLVASYKANATWQTQTNAIFVHSCDVSTFADITNPVTNEYYSLKNDLNYKNPLDQTQLDVRKWNGSSWDIIDIG